MTLVITGFAAVIATIAWYVMAPKDTYKLSVLGLMYWGATLMWCVDGIASVMEGGAFVDVSNAAATFDDSMLGLVIVLVGLVAWAAVLLLKDPKHVFMKMFGRKVS
jgi:hypothetical protein